MNTKPHTIADGYSGIIIKEHDRNIYTPTEKEQEFLNTFVKEQQERAKKVNGVFTDGDLIGIKINELKTNDNNIEVKLQSITYSQHAGLFRKNRDALIQAWYVAALVITRDEQIVFGSTQATEADWMGKLGIPAGGIEIGPDGMATAGAQLYKELSEEIGLIPEHHISGAIIPGWTNGTSAREGNYHLSSSFIVPISFTAKEFNQYFMDWKDSVDKLYALAAKDGHPIKKPEFKDLTFIPNDKTGLVAFIKEQDAKGPKANLLGKSLDMIDTWTSQYGCSIEKLKASKYDGPRIYLPQPLVG